MSKPTVLLIGPLTHCNEEWHHLGNKYELKEFRNGSRQEFIAQCKRGEYDDVVGLYRSNLSNPQTGPFNQEIVDVLPKGLKYICHNGAGYDNIDVDACTRRGIAVSSTPIAVDDATADVGIFLMLGALRQAQTSLEAIRAGQWRGNATLGHDPKAELEGDATYVSFDDLLAQSDILSLNLALNAKTRHIISAREFAKMKDGVVIVNTARGALIKEKDLVEALNSGKVASAGLDVFEHEPQVDSGLIQSRKTFIAPHIGTHTYETQRAMELLVLQNLESAVDGKGLLTQIPEQKTKLVATNHL
ncbi:hypothetical protein DV735_g4783, partial [Chaetothyriales sp. CBS 134920]